MNRMSDAEVSSIIEQNLILSIKAKADNGEILLEEGIIALKTAFLYFILF